MKSVQFGLPRPKTAINLTSHETLSGNYTLNDTKVLSKLVDKNSGYFDHAQDQCKCAICICGLHKCKERELKEQKGMPTLSEYQKQYIEKSSSKNKQILQPEEYKDSYQMKFETNNRLDYVEKKQRPQTSMKQKPQTFLTPFHAASTYQLTHINMPETEKVDIIPQNFTTVMKELEFIGDTEYRRTYKAASQGRKDPFINFGAHSSFGNPISSQLPFYGISSTHKSFRPFKGRALKPEKSEASIKQTPSFYGQFTTTAQRDFTLKGRSLCPARG